MSIHDPLHKLASDNGFDIATAGREELVAHIEALEDLYRTHPAQETLDELHRYLFPERYADIPMYKWHAGTIDDVAQRIEQALPHAPRAQTIAKWRTTDRYQPASVTQSVVPAQCADIPCAGRPLRGSHATRAGVGKSPAQGGDHPAKGGSRVKDQEASH